MSFSVWLTIPCRSLLNLDTELVASNLKETAQVIQAATKNLESDHEVVRFHSPYLSYASEGVRFQNLDDNDVTLFSLPVFSIEYLPGFSKDEFSAFKASCFKNDDVPSFSVDNVCTHLYDNTLSIVTLRLELELDDVPDNWGAKEFEQFTSVVSEYLVRPLHNKYVTPVIQALSSACILENGWREKKSFVHPLKEFGIYDDLASHPYPLWNEKISSLLWSARLYILDEWDKKHLEKYKAISRYDHVMNTAQEPVNGVYIAVGTCFVQHESLVQPFLRSNCLNQYFYCLFDALNKAHSNLYKEIGGQSHTGDLALATRKFDDIETSISYVKNEFSDSVLGAQGIERATILSMYDVFDTDTLVDVIQKRGKLLGAKLEREVQRNRLAQEKLFKAILFILGATGVYEVIVNMFNYANAWGGKYADTTPGVLDIMPFASFNMVINIVTFSVLAGALFIIFKRED